MKKSATKTNNVLVDIPPFDFDHSVPNPFVERYREGVETVILTVEEKPSVILEPDVAAYFPDSESVNAALRTLIAAFSKIEKPHSMLRKNV